MNHTCTSPRNVLIVGCATIVFLAACGGSEDSAAENPAVIDTTDTATSPESTPAVTEAMTEPAESESATTEPATTEPATTEPVVTEPAALGLPECLIGDWIVTADELSAYYGAIGENLPGDVTMSTTGTAGMLFTATEYTYSGDFTLDMQILGQTATGTATGSATGTWELSDGVISAELVSSDVDISVSIGGASLDQGDLGNMLIRANPVHEAPVSCDGPTINFESGDGLRHPILLTPA